MDFLELLKFLAELIASIATAVVVIIGLFELMFKLSSPMKKFFKITVPLFFGGYTNLDGTKTRFCKGMKLERERRIRILKATSPDFEMEDVLVLDKKALLDIISKSSAFRTIQLRKNQETQ